MDKKHLYGKKYMLIHHLKRGIVFKSPLLKATKYGNEKDVDIIIKT